MNLKLTLSLLTIGLFVATLSGCGGSNVPTAAVTGTITINGEPAKGVSLQFAPKSGDRASVALTEADGTYRAQFVKNQTGVALGPCVVKFFIYRGESGRNYLPKEFNDNAAANPDFNIDIPPGGTTFDYDLKFDGEYPEE